MSPRWEFQDETPVRLTGDPRGRRWTDRLPGQLLQWPFRARRSFGALVTPGVLHVVQYEARPRELTVLRYHWRALDHGTDGPAAAEALADLIEAEGGRGGRVAIALSGFGAAHELLRLPPADADVLRPVVEREFGRMHPRLAGERIGFLPLGLNEARQGVRSQDVFAAAAPRALVDALRAACARRDVAVHHVTVLPQAVQRVYDAYARRNDASLVLMLLPGLSAMAAMRDGRLRLYWEPILRTAPGGAPDPQILRERLRQGTYFVMQEFRGRPIERAYLSAEPEHRAEVGLLAEQAVDVPVERLGPEEAPPGLLLALGAALDAADGAGLDLLPADARPRSVSARMSTGLVAATGALVLAGAVWWAAEGNRALRQAEARVELARRAYDAQVEPMAAIEPVIEQRRAAAERAAFLGELEQERLRLQDMLGSIALSASPAIRLDRLTLAPGGAGWIIELEGVAVDYTAAAAMRAVDQLYRELQRRLAVEQIQLTKLEDQAPAPEEGGAGGAVAFGLSFEVSAAETPQGEEAGA